MPKILESTTFIEYFDLDKKGETGNLSEKATYMWLIRNHSEVTSALLKWSEEKYPNAPHLDHLCFAGLVAYFATGAYSGFGTENVQKERFAEHKAYEFYTHLHEKLSPEQMTLALIEFLISHLLLKSPIEDGDFKKIKRAIALLEDSKKSFKSKQIAEARKILEGI